MYVYILKSCTDPSKYYVGLTVNLKTRFAEHNAGKSIYTRNLKPWIIEVAFWFPEKTFLINLAEWTITLSS